jgi:hypothetical protein
MTASVLGAIIYGLMAFAVPTSNGECVLKARSLVDRQLPLPDGFKLTDEDDKSDGGFPSGTDDGDDEEDESNKSRASQTGFASESAQSVSDEIEELYDFSMDSNPSGRLV